MGAFHAYDIRGIYNEDFNKEDVYKIGYFLPSLLKSKAVLIGRDVRVSSPEIFEYLVRGVLDAGADVYDAGLCTTPMVYWMTAKFDFHASVMITASHNGPEYNGLKVSQRHAMPVGYADGLGDLEKMMQEKNIVVQDKKGKVLSFDKKAAYVAFQREMLPKNLDILNLSIDCSNGMAGLIVKEIIGEGHHFLYEELDGRFPNHQPNPLVLDNVKDLQEAVLKNQSDLGIIFDGDADRVMFVDEKGAFISPDLMIALMGHYFAPKHPHMKVIQDIRTSKAVGEYLQQLTEVEMITWRVGRAFAARRLRQEDGLFGGELAGHYYFKDFYYSDSAMMAMLVILNVILEMKENGLSLSQLIEKVKAYASSGEVNFKIEDKTGAMERVKDFYLEKFTPSKFMDFDGYRLEFEDWWFNIRPSNTEPYLRLIVEAKTQELMEERLTEIKALIGM
jgi:phosphomannomutase